MNDQKTSLGLQPYLSPAAAWTLAVGTSVGWGSLVVTSNTYLAQAGPAGSILGLLIGMALMLIMCRNFYYLASRYPRAGGVYDYTKEVFGYDRAFLVFWFLGLTYIAMFWANATSLPLFARFFIGDTFKFGYLFSVFGYEVYLGEALLTLVAIAAIPFLCIKSKMAAAHVMVILVAVFTLGITLCFIVAAVRNTGGFNPAFIPDKSAVRQTLRIAFISPWAFIGFENITHSAEEFKFNRDKLYRILVASVVTSTAIYIFVTLLSISAYPADCSNWLAYIRNLSNYSGIEGLPAFYAARHYLGGFGVAILMYEEKQLLKALGAVTRDNAEEEAKAIIPMVDDNEVIHLKRHVLIVEDEPINLMMLGNMLQDAYDLLYASNGIEALEQLKVHKDELALVMLDLQMPRMSGMEVLQVMKEEAEWKDIPVIVLTADQSAEVECLKHGAMDFIPKPYPSMEIVRARAAANKVKTGHVKAVGIYDTEMHKSDPIRERLPEAFDQFIITRNRELS